MDVMKKVWHVEGEDEVHYIYLPRSTELVRLLIIRPQEDGKVELLLSTPRERGISLPKILQRGIFESTEDAKSHAETYPAE